MLSYVLLFSCCSVIASVLETPSPMFVNSFVLKLGFDEAPEYGIYEESCDIATASWGNVPLPMFFICDPLLLIVPSIKTVGAVIFKVVPPVRFKVVAA